MELGNGVSVGFSDIQIHSANVTEVSDSEFAVVDAGVYLVMYTVGASVTAPGAATVGFQVLVNGTPYPPSIMDSTTDNDAIVSVSFLVSLHAGDVLELALFGATDIALDLTTGASLSIVRLS